MPSTSTKQSINQPITQSSNQSNSGCLQHPSIIPAVCQLLCQSLNQSVCQPVSHVCLSVKPCQIRLSYLSTQSADQQLQACCGNRIRCVLYYSMLTKMALLCKWQSCYHARGLQGLRNSCSAHFTLSSYMVQVILCGVASTLNM